MKNVNENSVCLFFQMEVQTFKEHMKIGNNLERWGHHSACNHRLRGDELIHENVTRMWQVIAAHCYAIQSWIEGDTKKRLRPS
jgi:hypothetical protein